MSNEGKIVQIIGPVVDADFSGAEKLPEIYNAIEVHYDLNGVNTKLVLEVQQHLGDGWVRAVAMSTTEGLKRGLKVVNTGKPISVPVGECVLGRIFNVTGDAVDERGPVNATKYYPIHRPAPSLVEQATSAEILETGIKVIDLICPFTKGGKSARSVGQGSARPLSSWSSLTILRRSTEVTPSSPGSVNGPARGTTYTGK